MQYLKDMFKWLKRLFSKDSNSVTDNLIEETRYIQSDSEISNRKLTLTGESVNKFIAQRLRLLCDENSLPEYKNIQKFILKHYDEVYPQVQVDVVLVEIEPTKELLSLAKTWNLLGYKCSDINFSTYMKSLL